MRPATLWMATETASRETPAFAIRRLRELATEARVLEVRLTGKAPPDWRGAVPRGPATGDHRSMLRTLQREVQERIDYFRSLPERPCGPNTPTGVANTGQEVPQ